MSDKDDPPIGPTGHFTFGAPYFKGDRGGIHIGFKLLRHTRNAMLSFGDTAVTTFIATPQEARRQAVTMRDMIVKRFGNVPYDVRGLPIRVGVHKVSMVAMVLPIATPVLVMNIEAFLALAERLEQVADQCRVQ